MIHAFLKDIVPDYIVRKVFGKKKTIDIRGLRVFISVG